MSVHFLADASVGAYLRRMLPLLLMRRIAGRRSEVFVLKGEAPASGLIQFLCRLTSLSITRPAFAFNRMHDPQTGEWCFTRCYMDATRLAASARLPAGAGRARRVFGSDLDHVAKAVFEDEARAVLPMFAAARSLVYPGTGVVFLKRSPWSGLYRSLAEQYGLSLRFVSSRRPRRRLLVLRLGLSLFKQRLFGASPSPAGNAGTGMSDNADGSILLTQDHTELFRDNSYRNQPHWAGTDLRTRIRAPIYILKRPGFHVPADLLDRLRAQNAFIVDTESKTVLPGRPLDISYRQKTRAAAAVSILTLAAGVLFPSRFFWLVELLRDVHSYECLMRKLGVRVFVTLQGFRNELLLAARASGACSIRYMVSNQTLLSRQYGADIADFTCVFGPAFETFLDQSGQPCGQTIVTGYPFLDGLETIRRRALPVKERLRAAGAELIVCLFDENWLAEQYSPVTRADHVRLLSFFLDWLIENPRIGLVLKVQYVRNLPNAYPELEDRIRRVEASGRYFAFTEGQYVVQNLPAEAALASDVCVSLIYGGTAGLESALAGVPAFLLDEYSYRYARVPEGMRDRIIVSSLQEIRRRCEAADFRQNLPDWSPFLSQMDPFRDGNAGSRLCDLIQLCMEKDPESAAQIFRGRWAAN